MYSSKLSLPIVLHRHVRSSIETPTFTMVIPADLDTLDLHLALASNMIHHQDYLVRRPISYAKGSNMTCHSPCPRPDGLPQRRP